MRLVICANCTDEPAFFTPCARFGGVCVCGEQVKSEMEEEA